MQKEAQIGLGAAMLIWVVVMSIPEVATSLQKGFNIPWQVYLAFAYATPVIVLIPCLAIVRMQSRT